ncbi:MAG: GWxTD domain-containing protein [Bacteroidota bacterium]
MRHIIGFLLCLLPAAPRAFAIEASVSHTVFYAPHPTLSGKLVPYVETFWQVNPRKLHFSTTPDKKIIARIRTDIVYTGDTGVILEDHFIQQTSPRASVEELASLVVMNVKRYSVTHGVVKVKLTFTDLGDTGSHAAYHDSFVIAPQLAGPFFSGLQILDTVVNATEETPFTKNGRQQIPVATNFLDDHKRILHYYAELYSADQLARDNYPLIMKVYITKQEDGPPGLKNVKTDTISSPSDLISVTGDFSVAAQSSGNYYLKATLENSERKIIASNTLFYQRLNLHPAKEEIVKAQVSDTALENVTVLNLNKTFIAKYTLAQTRAVLKMLLPVSDGEGAIAINGFLKKPDELYMRYFIYNYFAAIDKKNPEKAWKEFSDNVRNVNKRFSEYGTPGYETERGGVFMRYGEPSEVATVANEKGSLPYEVWQYNSLIQRNGKNIPNAVFLFYRQGQQMSPYRLLHSTVSNEIVNPRWRSYLYTNTEGGTSSNSRAEQYLGNR